MSHKFRNCWQIFYPKNREHGPDTHFSAMNSNILFRTKADREPEAHEKPTVAAADS